MTTVASITSSPTAPTKGFFQNPVVKKKIVKLALYAIAITAAAIAAYHGFKGNYTIAGVSGAVFVASIFAQIFFCKHNPSINQPRLNISSFQELPNLPENIEEISQIVNNWTNNGAYTISSKASAEEYIQSKWGSKMELLGIQCHIEKSQQDPSGLPDLNDYYIVFQNAKTQENLFKIGVDSCPDGQNPCFTLTFEIN